MTIVNLHVPTGKGPAVELRGDTESMALGQDHAVLVVAATDQSGHLNVATQALVEHGFVAGGDASIRVWGGRPDDSQIYLKGNRLLLAESGQYTRLFAFDIMRFVWHLVSRPIWS